MITIETKALVTPDGKMTVQVPINLPPGEHRVVMVIEEQSSTSPIQPQIAPLKLNAYAWANWPADATFRREEIYDDDGR